MFRVRIKIQDEAKVRLSQRQGWLGLGIEDRSWGEGVSDQVVKMDGIRH